MSTQTHRTSAGDEDGGGWTIVVPVKRAEVAKSRLAPFAGAHRPDLARAMALDTVSATLACPAVAEVLTVTDDPVSAQALRDLGAVVVPDEPDAGLNPALVHGSRRARERRPGCPVAAMSADLPALRPHELARVLSLASHHSSAFIPDTAGTGTTLYCATNGTPFRPRFGPDSRAAHQDSGAAELQTDGIASVRRDVDTEADLREAVALGVGERTRAVLRVLEAAPARRPG